MSKKSKLQEKIEEQIKLEQDTIERAKTRLMLLIQLLEEKE